jgi:hypothetical protein
MDAPVWMANAVFVILVVLGLAAILAFERAPRSKV